MRGGVRIPPSPFLVKPFWLIIKKAQGLARWPGPPSPRAHRPGRGPNIFPRPGPLTSQRAHKPGLSWAAGLLFTARPARWRPLYIDVKEIIKINDIYLSIGSIKLICTLSFTFKGNREMNLKVLLKCTNKQYFFSFYTKI